MLYTGACLFWMKSPHLVYRRRRAFPVGYRGGKLGGNSFENKWGFVTPSPFSLRWIKRLSIVYSFSYSTEVTYLSCFLLLWWCGITVQLILFFTVRKCKGISYSDRFVRVGKCLKSFLPIWLTIIDDVRLLFFLFLHICSTRIPYC
jgi:hypothetical protein